MITANRRLKYRRRIIIAKYRITAIFESEEGYDGECYLEGIKEDLHTIITDSDFCCCKDDVKVEEIE